MTMPKTTYANQEDVLSEEAFLELTGLRLDNFRRLVREGRIPGAVKLADNCYVVILSIFVAYAGHATRTVTSDA